MYAGTSLLYTCVYALWDKVYVQVLIEHFTKMPVDTTANFKSCTLYV